MTEAVVMPLLLLFLSNCFSPTGLRPPIGLRFFWWTKIDLALVGLETTVSSIIASKLEATVLYLREIESLFNVQFNPVVFAY